MESPNVVDGAALLPKGIADSGEEYSIDGDSPKEERPKSSLADQNERASPAEGNNADAFSADGLETWHDEQKMKDEFEAIIKADEEKMIPDLGRDGKPATNPPYVTMEESKKVMRKEAFNKILSDLIPFTRRIPDARHEKYDILFI